MTPRTTGILVVLGVIALGGGWYFGPGSVPRAQESAPRGSLMFPDLASKLKDAAKLEILHQGKTLTIEKRPDGKWGIASLNNYPVQESKLRGTLTGLTELRLQEPRTSDAAQYARLGVDDPGKPDSTADLLRLLDGSGKPVAAVILGHRRVRSQADVPEEVYVRRPDDAQSWLAQGSVSADSDPSQWLDRNLLNIPADRIQAVTVGDDALMFDRKDGSFALRHPTDPPKLDSYKVEDVSRALENLTLMAVKPDADAPKDEAGRVTFLTGDGLAIKATVFHAGKDVWARFAAGGDNKAEADRLNARLAGWTFQIPNWKEKSLVPTLDDLKAAEPEKPAPAPQSAAPPTGAPADGSK
ncbi:MAG: DUF4340 domain-containing protein [Acetobacteraceae bacterium]